MENQTRESIGGEREAALHTRRLTTAILTYKPEADTHSKKYFHTALLIETDCG